MYVVARPDISLRVNSETLRRSVTITLLPRTHCEQEAVFRSENLVSKLSFAWNGSFVAHKKMHKTLHTMLCTHSSQFLGRRHATTKCIALVTSLFCPAKHLKLWTCKVSRQFAPKSNKRNMGFKSNKINMRFNLGVDALANRWGSYFAQAQN